MIAELATALAAIAACAAIVALLAVLRQAATLERLRLLGEQALAGQRGETETLRAQLAATERALLAAQSSNAGQLRAEVAGALADMRTALDARLRELREGNEAKLAEIQKTVNEQLHAAVEKQMTASFARVSDQFTALQKAMGDVTAVTAQIGDIKRLFGNVKTRGGWGEAQVRAMLDDILPEGAYDTNWKPRPESDDAVEFAVIMPMRGRTVRACRSMRNSPSRTTNGCSPPPMPAMPTPNAPPGAGWNCGCAARRARWRRNTSRPPPRWNSR